MSGTKKEEKNYRREENVILCFSIITKKEDIKVKRDLRFKKRHATLGWLIYDLDCLNKKKEKKKKEEDFYPSRNIYVKNKFFP